MTTDTSERGLERLICEVLTGNPCDPPPSGTVGEPPPGYGGIGWSPGNGRDYDRVYCVDPVQLRAFLEATQPEAADALRLAGESPTRRKFLARLQSEINKRGTIDVLRRGVRHGPHHLELFHGTPSAGNETARGLFEANRFTVVRQLRYSRDETQRALDIVLFINGLPVFTFELKNNLTKQTVHDAVRQYERDRNPREPLFRLGRCVAHFAVDESEVRFCTHLKGKASWFLPFNRGWNQGAGNPPNPDGLKTEYLWREVLARGSLTDILENYAQLLAEQDPKTGRKKRKQIWPRYQQLEVVRRLLANAARHGAGKRYLIQHSAGSGKSFSIAWLAHQMIPLEREGETVFDSIIVVTDRRILDRQIRDTIKQYGQVKANVGHAKRSGDLRRFIEQGKKIIITTIQKFPFILDEIGSGHRDRSFAIIIDEAHSSQGGKAAGAMADALGEGDDEDGYETYEDRINREIKRRRMLDNASYFAFTATPKNRTLELFGEPDPQTDGTVRRLPFHTYSMKQAIQEGFILDVLEHYTPVESYYRLAKTVEEDPEYDVRKAGKKLRRYVEGHEHAIRLKAEIMVDHFHEQVLAQHRIGGKARAMVVTNGIERAIQYFYAIRDYLRERRSPHAALVAFSGEHDFKGDRVTEASLNGLPSSKIAETLQEDPYRFLVCADKFQTGYDEPLLHTMYVDKTLSGIRAVQTLSRLNRSHPEKRDVFVLDFLNDTETIAKAFSDYYRTTILSDETGPDRLHDLQADLDGAQVYSPEEVRAFAKLYLDGAGRARLDPILDRCVAVYMEDLDEDGQVRFKGRAKAFTRAYAFLSSILPYNNLGWEERSIFLNFLIPKLPAPEEEDLSKGVLERIDMDSYRIEKHRMREIILEDEDTEIDPVQTGEGGGRGEIETDRLSAIIDEFNDLFGGIEWGDPDRVVRTATEDIPAAVAKDAKFKNARRNSDRENARVESDKATERAVLDMIQDDTRLFQRFSDDADFRRWLSDTAFRLAYAAAVAE
ncbi:MAG: type I restriction endonuclease subunit R [Gemmatimonadetes bacterium]|nr:type I restriction endonuclease subunit R [Gemmatimonadota bacterium]MYE92070.1 type I restriction endonuclease subunit R [Gemmatimonadota bacterium]MYJ10525.1 type I restriction endonuclease subunit R [Gemmatimonadota bacterium]